jgi:hypothetical protein
LWRVSSAYVVVAFSELDAQVGGLLFELGDLVVERVDVDRGAETGLPPGLLAEETASLMTDCNCAGNN